MSPKQGALLRAALAGLPGWQKRFEVLRCPDVDCSLLKAVAVVPFAWDAVREFTFSPGALAAEAATGDLGIHLCTGDTLVAERGLEIGWAPYCSAANGPTGAVRSVA